MSVEETDHVASMEVLPNELILNIITYLENPTTFSRTSKRMLSLSKDPLVRAQWLLKKYGGSYAFEASFSWSRIVDGETLEYLLKLIPRIPRYQLQRAVTRFQLKNSLECLIRVLQYGKDMYSEMSLDKHDTTLFRELTTAQAGFNALLNGIGMIGTMTTDFASLESLRSLVEDYGFEVNYSKFSNQSGVPFLDVNEGYRIFLAAIGANNLALTKALLNYGAVTHIQKPTVIFPRPYVTGLRPGFAFGLDIPVGTRRLPFYDTERFGQVNYAHYFPSDLRQYIPATADALIMATRSKNVEIVRLLLDHDIERWNEDHGLKVLKNALQLAVDENFTDGIQIIRSYLDSNEANPQKSAAALKRLLIEAVMRDNLADVKNLVLKEGARFESPGVVDIFQRQIDIFRNIVLGDKRGILSFLLKNYPSLTEYQLGDMLIHAIESINTPIINMILNNKTCKPRIYDRTLRRAIMKSCYDGFPALLKGLFEQVPHKTPSGWKPLLRVAEKRKKDGKDPEGFFLKQLQMHEEKINSHILGAFKAPKSKLRRVKKKKQNYDFDDDDDDYESEEEYMVIDDEDEDEEIDLVPILPPRQAVQRRVAPRRQSVVDVDKIEIEELSEDETVEATDADETSSHAASTAASENEGEDSSGRRRSSRKNKGKAPVRGLEVATTSSSVATWSSTGPPPRRSKRARKATPPITIDDSDDEKRNKKRKTVDDTKGFTTKDEMEEVPPPPPEPEHSTRISTRLRSKRSGTPK